MSPDLVWATWIALFAVFETAALVSKKNGDTLSERTRDWFATHTGKGRATFLTGWVIFSVWFGWHIAFQP